MAKGKRDKRKQGPLSDDTVFEMLIRFDHDFTRGLTAQLLWLLWAQSRRLGYASYSERQLGLLLRSTDRQIAKSIHVICKEWGYFTHKKNGPGVHRPWRFTPNKRRGETDLDFKLRMWGDPRVNALVKLHWIASDQTARTGTAQFACTELNMSDDTLRRARNKMNELGHFTVGSGEGGRRVTAKYTRIQPSERQRERMEGLVALIREEPIIAKARVGQAQETPVHAKTSVVEEEELAPIKPAQRGKSKVDMEEVRRGQLDVQLRREWEQKARQDQHEARLALEMGVDLDGKELACRPIRRKPKEVHKIIANGDKLIDVDKLRRFREGMD